MLTWGTRCRASARFTHRFGSRVSIRSSLTTSASVKNVGSAAAPRPAGRSGGSTDEPVQADAAPVTARRPLTVGIGCVACWMVIPPPATSDGVVTPAVLQESTVREDPPLTPPSRRSESFTDCTRRARHVRSPTDSEPSSRRVARSLSRTVSRERRSGHGPDK